MRQNPCSKTLQYKNGHHKKQINFYGPALPKLQLTDRQGRRNQRNNMGDQAVRFADTYMLARGARGASGTRAL